MNHPDQEQFEELLSALIEGDLDEMGHRRLRVILGEHPPLLAEVRHHLQISELLSQQSPRRSPGNFLAALEDHIKSLGTDDEDELFIGSLFRRIRYRRITRYTLVAAAIAALAIPLAMLAPRPKPPVVAQATLLDSTGNPSVSEDVIEGRTIELKSGMMRLQFTNGAVVAIESPATLEVVSDMTIKLASGKLNAWCPKTAHGFQVVTHDTTLTDIGTAFGIEANPDGSSNFIVLEGSVKLNKDNEVHLLEQGSAMTTNQRTGLQASSFETAPYERTWAVSSGIINTTGSVVPAKPDTPENLARLFNDSEVMVVPEGRGLPFDDYIMAEVSEPGHLEITTNFVPPHIVHPIKGSKLNSYLVRVDPETELRGPQHIHFEGSVTFDHPVIAIILGSATLKATDIRFGKGRWPRIPGVINTSNRGLEINWNTTIHDEVTLSEDRKTVKIVFHTGGSTDDIRVITAE